MGLTYPYRRYPSSRPIVPLGGQTYRPQPVVLVGVAGPLGVMPVRALIDTGADDTVFSESVATTIGLDLSAAPTGTAQGVGGNAVVVRYAEVTLQLAQGNGRHEWRAWVGFASIPMRRALLGFAGFLQFFTATFHGDREEVELTANALLPPP
jgi:hypothetical protein